MIKTIFLGKHPENGGSCRGVDALKILVDNKEIDIVGCIPNDEDLLWRFCKQHNIKIKSIKDVEEQIENVDLIISYGFMKKIKEPLIIFIQHLYLNGEEWVVHIILPYLKVLKNGV